MKTNKELLRFTRRARLDKSINSLLGILEGIAVDQAINPEEIGFLRLWLEDHSDVRDRHPFTELVPAVLNAVKDGIITAEESADLKWLCERLSSNDFYDKVTGDIQRLHGILGGIAADALIQEAELRGLGQWLDDHVNLRRSWPYEEVQSLITGVLSDGKIGADEHKVLDAFFTDFTSLMDSKTVTSPRIMGASSTIGLCTVCPEIVFEGKTFCITGESTRFTREELHERIASLGGVVSASVIKSLDYLVIGANGNPCWAYACYGRKVERAIELRKAGSELILVHENDLHDAFANY